MSKSCDHQCQFKVQLEVNGKPVGINNFVQNVFGSAINGMVCSLKNAEKAQEIIVKIKRENKE
ncbi:hypothetical protein ACFLZV_00355 [Candidatus Margulisiibacteriota bacterium]